MLEENTDIASNWKNLLQISSQLRDLASQEDWQGVAELAISRHRDVTEHFQRYPVGPETAIFYSIHLSEFMKGEEEIQVTALAARRRIMKEGADISRGKKAINSYLNSAY